MMEPYNATITHWDQIADGLAIFRVTPDVGLVPAFEPGQYATLGLPRDHSPVQDPDSYPPGDPRWKALVRRDYSIASPATERGHLEFYTVHVGGGHLTDKLFAAGRGGRLWLDVRVRGDLTLAGVEQERDIALVATGTGLGPYLSMLRTYSGRGRWRKVAVIHGVRHARELGYRAELEALVREDPTIAYLPCCSRDVDPPGARHGRVTDLLNPGAFAPAAGFALSPASCHVFLCGNPGMIRDAEDALLPLGFRLHTRRTPGNLHAERYWNA